MKDIATAVIIGLMIVGSGIGTGFAGEQQKVTLKLGGEFCDAYPVRLKL